MTAPITLLGQGGGNRLFHMNNGADDNGVDILARGRTVRVAPAGPRGECIFPALYVMVSYTQQHTIKVHGRVDDRDLEVQSATLPAVLTGERKTEKFEFGLSEPHVQDLVEVFRVAPQGTWFEVWVEVDPVQTGDLVFEAIDLEYEVTREGTPADA